jgi:hypothetical protein
MYLEISVNIEQFELHSKVLVPFHRGAKVDVLDVNGHKFRVWRRYDAVEKELDCEEIWSRGSTVAGVVDQVASNHDSCVVFVFLSFPVNTYYSSVSFVTFAILWNVRLADEKDSFCCCCLSSNFLSE